MEAPIIFIHYNDPPYLKYVLQAVLKSNQGRRIVLIGDDSNAKYINIGIEHYQFRDYLTSSLAKNLEKVYKRVGGKDFEKINTSKGGEDWTKFNFMKWFVLYNFLGEQSINRFWTFDSDTLILSDLSE